MTEEQNADAILNAVINGLTVMVEAAEADCVTDWDFNFGEDTGILDIPGTITYNSEAGKKYAIKCSISVSPAPES